jgi:hypothetical protein
LKNNSENKLGILYYYIRKNKTQNCV